MWWSLKLIAKTPFWRNLSASVATHESEQFLVNAFIPIYWKEGRGRKEGRKERMNEGLLD
jgi:hypothetical protein